MGITGGIRQELKALKNNYKMLEHENKADDKAPVKIT